MWTPKRLLIWGKTYPEFSRQHYETVCTGAIDGENGQLLRIYPISLRYLQQQFSKYQWIEVPAERNTKDPRPESYRIQQESIVLGEQLGTNEGWAQRSRWVLASSNTYPSVESLRSAQAERGISLGLIRPREIIRFYARRKPDSERKEWEQKREEAISIKELFVDADSRTKDLAFMPVTYRAEFKCEESICNGHDMSILDWEVYVLSRKMFAQGGEQLAEKKVIEKLAEMTDAKARDCYFFLGNTQAHPTNFMIVGLYSPPKPAPLARQSQLSLFK